MGFISLVDEIQLQTSHDAKHVLIGLGSICSYEFVCKSRNAADKLGGLPHVFEVGNFRLLGF